MSWVTASIKDVCDIISGATPKTGEPRFWGGDIAWATPKDLSDLDSPYIGKTPRTITDAGLRNCAASVLPPNSVLLSSRAPIGLVAINSIPMATNQGFKSLVPNRDRIESGYLFHWLKSRTAYLHNLGNGATFKEISKAVVERIEIPLPPLDEQRRIAAILDKADTLRRKRKQALDLVNGLSQSIFLDLFANQIKNMGGSNSTHALIDLADITSGITKGRKLTDTPARKVPYLAVLNVQDKFLDLSTVKEIEASENEIDRYRLKKDDLLLTEGGDPDKLGRGALWADELDEAIHQNHIFRVRLKSKDIVPLYLMWLVGSQYGKSYFLRVAKQTTGIASINKRQLSDFPVIVPPIRTQIEFLEKIQSLKKILTTQTAASIPMSNLFASLQHRAFSGQL